MAVLFSHSSFSPLSFVAPSRSRSPPSRVARISSSSSSSASSQMNPQKGGEGRKRLMEFPYLSAPYRDLMVELVSAVETRLDPYLLPCTLPPDVQCYHNQTGTAHAALQIRSSRKPSPIDLVSASWLHCELPSGALNIMMVSAYMSPLTDAPHFLIELIQGSPTSLVIILDLMPRKDFVLHPDYLQTYYEETQLDRHRQLLEKVPEVRSYVSPTLYIRGLVSPTAILVRIETEAGRTERMEEIVRDHVSPIAKDVLGIWLDRCVHGGSETSETERSCLAQRDRIIKNKTIEVDLGTSLPRLFGQDVAARIVGAVKEVFNAED